MRRLWIYSKMMKCPHCSKEYKKRMDHFRAHVKKCKKRPKKVNHTIKDIWCPKNGLQKQVWETYIGRRWKAKCFCCRDTTLTPFSFQIRYIRVPTKNGTEIDNLLPICLICKTDMKKENWDDYVERKNYPRRRYGRNPTCVKGILWLQSLARMWFERKKPDSKWKKRWVQKWGSLPWI